MPKEYSVELGGRKRTLRYTRAERMEIERRFDCDMRSFIYEMCFPVENGKPTLGGRLECQEALIFYGLRHNGPKVTEDSVSKDLQGLAVKGESIYTPLATAIMAVMASGVMGWTPPATDEDESEGKAEAAASEGSPEKPT